MKIRPVGAEFCADRQKTNGHDEIKSIFAIFANAPKTFTSASIRHLRFVSNPGQTEITSLYVIHSL
jgi:hypothetical protein